MRTDSVVSSPVHLWLVVQPEDQVGEQLEEVLPQEQSHVKVNVAYVRLAHVSSVAHVAHADKLVDEVAAIASIQTRVGLALVDLLLAPVPDEAWRTVAGELAVGAVASIEAGVISGVIAAHRNRKLWPYIFDNNVPRNFFNAFAAEETERKMVRGGRKRRKQTRQTKGSRFHTQTLKQPGCSQ